ncbi:MAG: Na+/H+ antiporter NhaA [Gammaproteobacteria bacterium]|nr:Na+/H+ antiporter NhaA [Gammaproteobacteria bacterium]MCI0591786.1 Na+/H+ antiporter NhaA [Gammaproteobacteria bacterium]
MPINVIKRFLKLESVGGIVLIASAVVAIVLANSPLQDIYRALLDVRVAISVGDLAISKPILMWINEGLMAVFFLLVGLEIKREVLEGEMSSPSQIVLPGLAALGGMIIPALIYFTFNWGDPIALRGWAIPTATDIAFALGVLMLLGSRVPIALKVFLTAIAIFDDLGAIIIIGLFYSSDLSPAMLWLASIPVAFLIVLNLAGVTRLTPYVLAGIAIWLCVVKSGVHATLAGALLGLLIPLKTKDITEISPLRYLENSLHPWVAYGVLPLFAFANAGFSVEGMSAATLLQPIPLGIALGLFLGKQLGVFGCAWAASRLGVARLPGDSSPLAVYGVAILTGIGFTMSLFIGTLAFPDPEYAPAIRVAVLSGSLFSAIVGYIILVISLPPQSTFEADE